MRLCAVGDPRALILRMVGVADILRMVGVADDRLLRMVTVWLLAA